MKVLCFGDSNTYGYDPCDCFGARYPAQYRWVDLLACGAVNAGENGREIPRREGAFERLMAVHSPIDLLIIMLGTNDLLQGNSPEAVAARMEGFLKRIALERDRILLVAPPAMKLGAWVPTRALVDDSAQLGRCYGELARRMGIRFANAAAWDLPLAFDGVHLTEAGHVALAEKIRKWIV